MKKGNTFRWSETLEEAFRAAKDKIIEEVQHGIRIFEKKQIDLLSYRLVKNWH